MTNPIPGDIKIKDFGRDRKFRSVDELQSTLSEQYKGQHVSIVYPAKPSGLLRTVFVSVLWSSFFGHADQMVGLCTGGQLGGRAGQRFVLCG
ncbi:hypothetical protein [Klebsiella pneumoniae]|uniref:hypothetical protein n=1 Tax=Klebsiella pneumoniae TaxID=573 RepID=UPI003B5C67EA